MHQFHLGFLDTNSISFDDNHAFFVEVEIENVIWLIWCLHCYLYDTNFREKGVRREVRIFWFMSIYFYDCAVSKDLRTLFTVSSFDGQNDIEIAMVARFSGTGCKFRSYLKLQHYLKFSLFNLKAKNILT